MSGRHSGEDNDRATAIVIAMVIAICAAVGLFGWLLGAFDPAPNTGMPRLDIPATQATQPGKY